MAGGRVQEGGRRPQLERADRRRAERDRVHSVRHRALRLLRRRSPGRQPVRATAWWRSTRAPGKRLWHHQLVHHDLWDYDLPQAPKLLTLRQNGRNIDVVAQATKFGFIFVFDRKTGQPIFPIEERPVPQSDVPGEKSWPTQPFPTKPAPFARQSFTEKDINPYLPEAEKETAASAAAQREERGAVHAAESRGFDSSCRVTTVAPTGAAPPSIRSAASSTSSPRTCRR